MLFKIFKNHKVLNNSLIQSPEKTDRQADQTAPNTAIQMQ